MAFQLDVELVQKSFELGSPCVYWIKHKDHTDVTKEGYVGISKNIRARISSHNWALRNRNHSAAQCSSLYCAVDKYGFENLEIKIILFADFQYCEDVERKLRPNMYIGWNIMQGGICPPRGRPPEKSKRVFVKRQVDDETRARMSNSAINRYKYTKHPRLGSKHSEESKIKMSESSNRKCSWDFPWDAPTARLDRWILADKAYEAWKETSLGYIKLGKQLGQPKTNTFKLMVDMFRLGWIPSEDSNWLNFKERFEDAGT